MLLLLLLVLLCILLLHYYSTMRYTYWFKKNVPCPKPSLFLWNSRNMPMLRVIAVRSFQKIYKEYEGYPFVGLYHLATPVLLIRDPNLIRHVLVKDFTYFQSRGIAIDSDSLDANLVNLSGQRWRTLRTKLTPAFTASKIRHIFGLITTASEKLKQLVKEQADNEEPVEFLELAAKFTSETIASCFFGFETNTLQNDTSEFRRICKRIMDPSLKMAIMLYIRDHMPKVLKWLPISLITPDIIAYFTGLVGNMITYRQTNNVTRNDIMQILIDLKYKKIQKDTQVQSQDGSSETSDIIIDDKLIAAQVYILLLAGLESSSVTMSFCMYELAANPKIQERLYNEIRTLYEKHGCFSYDTISEMEYLDRIIHETLRKYPPVGATQRICEKSYRIPNSNVVIEKGTKVIVPIYAIHHDPLHYKNPDTFDPDRFLDENKKLRDNHTFLPFGDGPRICIGMRFAFVEIKAALVALIANYKVELSEKMILPLQFNQTSLTLRSKFGMWLRFRYRLQDLTKWQS